MSSQHDELVVGNCFGGINVATTMLAPDSSPKAPSSPSIFIKTSIPDICKDCDCSLSELFDFARQFFKEKQDKQEIHVKYDDNLQFVALTKQIKYGKWNPSYTQNIGLLDVVGNNRKQAWISLGDMSKETAMEEFIKLIYIRYSSFQISLEEFYKKNRKRKEDEIRETLEKERTLNLARIEEQRKKEEEFQRKQIQQVLNQQTYSQFKAYAETHFKDNPQAQETLIRQLQEDHYRQYLRQVYQQRNFSQEQDFQTKNMEQQQQVISEQQDPVLSMGTPLTITTPLSPAHLPPLGPAPVQLPPVIHPPPQSAVNGMTITNEQSMTVHNQFETLSVNAPVEATLTTTDSSPADASTQPAATTLPSSHQTVDNPAKGEETSASIEPNKDAANASSDPSETGKSDTPNIVLANMWTRKDMKEFKDQLRNEKDAVIKIGSGETVTVRVPTHEDGKCIFWEFTTDYYDLGFGVYFEWSKAPSNTVTVHVSDSSDEDEEGEDGNNPEKKDIEKGASGSTNKPPKPRQDEIVPICRRDCHEEVYAGSHQYPGEGIYLLKFDNSYSLWRSKTLYYRVYYSK